jgi:hypothetical protein
VSPLFIEALFIWSVADEMHMGCENGFTAHG